MLGQENLEELDRWNHDLVVLSVFEDERPLRGLNGLTDWRYHGKLSNLIMNEGFCGKLGEKLLNNTSTYLGAKRLLVYGLGKSNSFDNMAYVRAGEDLFKTIQKLKAASILMALPGTQGRDPYLLDRIAVLAKQIYQFYGGEVTLLIDQRENLLELRAKFDLIERELIKTARFPKTEAAPAQPKAVPSKPVQNAPARESAAPAGNVPKKDSPENPMKGSSS